MKTIVAILAIISAITAFTIPQAKLERKEMPSGIINGTNASISDYSFLASLSWDIGGWPLLVGSGIILSPEWILTAAVNVHNVSSENVTVRVGSSSASEGGQVVNVSKIVIHPGFNASTWQNDVALVRVEQELTLSENVTLASLTVIQPEVNTTAVVAGFGVALRNLTSKDVDFGRLTSVNVTIDNVEEIQLDANSTQVIRTRDSSNGGPTIFDWGSPLIVDGEIAGLYIGNITLPSARNSTTTDNFVDLTQPEVYEWILETIL